MFKAVPKKSHWSARVSECAVRRDAAARVPLQGGAEDGEFVYVGRVDHVLSSVTYEHGSLTEGDLLLEVAALPVSGLPLYDVLSAMRSSAGPVTLKTVRP
ncbi:membrane-associated guanylate kinase, WW and PDZ domain-containing protein 1 isoform X1, partial [Clarias magur]